MALLVRATCRYDGPALYLKKHVRGTTVKYVRCRECQVVVPI